MALQLTSIRLTTSDVEGCIWLTLTTLDQLSIRRNSTFLALGTTPLEIVCCTANYRAELAA